MDEIKNMCEDMNNIPSNTNELKILIKRLLSEFKKYYDDTTKSLLCHDKTLAELITYIKENLNNSLRDLVDSMIQTGEFEKLVKDIILTSDPVSIREYGAVGDGITDDTACFMSALDNEVNIYIPKGVYRITKEINIPNNTIISGCGEDSILKIECEKGLITSKANTIIENIKIVGNDENTGLSIYQNKQILRNISFEHLNIGCENKNSDYMGSVKFIDLSFDYVNTCFKSDTLTNGVSFNRIVAYHFTNILEAYWLESVGFNNCFFEKGNVESRLIKTLENKTNCRAMSVAFNSCYIENIKELFDGLISGVIKFDSCWLFTKETFYNYPNATNNLKLLFINTSFGLSSNLNKSSVIFNLSKTHQISFNNIYGMINGLGAFDVKAGVNVVGGMLTGDKPFKQISVNGSTNENGVIKPELSSAKQRIVCCYGYVKDGSSNVYMTPYMTGENWNIVCRNPLSNNVIANKEIQVRITYIENTNIEVV